MTDVISWKGFEDIHFSELVKQYKYFICDTNRAVFCFVQLSYMCLANTKSLTPEKHGL